MSNSPGAGPRHRRALQFVICYVNLAVPSSAGRVAITTRFFQRFGIRASALSSGLIDSVSELIVQTTLFTLVFFISDIDLGLSVSTGQLSGLATTALVVIAVLVVTGVIAFAVPSWRRRALDWLHQAHDALQVMHDPRKFVQPTTYGP